MNDHDAKQVKKSARAKSTRVRPRTTTADERAPAPGRPRFVQLTPVSPALGTEAVFVNPDNVAWLEDRLLAPDRRTTVLHVVGQPLSPLHVEESVAEVTAAFDSAERAR